MTAAVTLWLLAGVGLMCAPPAAIIAFRPAGIVAALVATLAGWALLLRFEPGVGMAGGLLMLGLWGISIITTLVAIAIRIRDALA